MKKLDSQSHQNQQEQTWSMLTHTHTQMVYDYWITVTAKKMATKAFGE